MASPTEVPSNLAAFDAGAFVAAIAWPVAIVIASLAVVAIVFRIFPKGRTPALQVEGPGGWKVSTSHGPQTEELNAVSATQAEASPDIDNDAKGSFDLSIAGEVNADAPDGAADPESENNKFEFVFTKSSSDLQELFDEFKNTDEYKKDRETWDTFLVQRRRDLGLGGGNEELRKLADENLTWTKPLLRLARRVSELGDFSAATEIYKEAESRSTDESLPDIKSEQAITIFDQKGAQASTEFIRSLLMDGANPNVISESATIVAKRLKDSGDEASARILYEIALRHNQSDNSARFDLAHLYGAQYGLETRSFYHYNLLMSRDYSVSAVANNLGILAEEVKKSLVQYSFLEDAIEKQNPLAHSNLANELIGAGFVKRAEIVLDATSSLQGFEENAAASKVKLLSAARQSTEEREAMRTLAAAENRKFQRLFGEALEWWQSLAPASASGTAFTADGHNLEIIDGAVKVSVTVSTEGFSGSLKKAGFVYSGTVYQNSKSLMTAESRNVFAAQISASVFQVLVSPPRGSWAASELIELTKCEPSTGQV